MTVIFRDFSSCQYYEFCLILLSYWDCSAQSYRWHTPLHQLKKIMSFCFRAPVWTRLIKSWINTRLERLTEERRYMYWIHVFCVSSPLYLKNKRLWLIAILHDAVLSSLSIDRPYQQTTRKMNLPILLINVTIHVNNGIFI